MNLIDYLRSNYEVEFPIFFRDETTNELIPVSEIFCLYKNDEYSIDLTTCYDSEDCSISIYQESTGDFIYLFDNLLLNIISFDSLQSLIYWVRLYYQHKCVTH